MVFFPKDKFLMKVDPFTRLKWCLRLWGQQEKLMKFCYFLLALKFFNFLCRIIFIIKSENDMEVLLEISATYPIPFLAITKLGFLLWRRKNVQFLFSTVTEQFWDISVAGHCVKNRLEKRFKFINSFLFNAFTTCFCYICLYLAFNKPPKPEGRTRWTPFLISFPMNQDKSPVYEILLVILIWNMSMSVIGNGFFDFTFVYAAQHLCGQLILLKALLRNLDFGLMEGVEDIEKFRSPMFQKEIRNRIKICVRHHNLLLKYANELKDLTSPIFGLQLCTTLLTLVLAGFILSENIEEIVKSAMILSFVCSSSLQFIIFAIQSTDIYSQSSTVSGAAYQCKWYLFDAITTRDLVLFIMNSQNAVVMYGAGLIAINNEIIVTMAQKIFSCITLLKSLAE